mmetsp:Transcript_19488/g.43380  ORF Transcript_19488/g.43380 Transcript_19488/m.43380 type:complete len:799 (-) Transcript_19488:1145-3541(-)
MFGAARRKKKPRPVLKAADSSDDDGDVHEKETSKKMIEHGQAKRKKQKKRKMKAPKTLSLSFDPDDGEDAVEDDTPPHSTSSSRKKHKKRSKPKKNSSLGYGGALQMSESDASDEGGVEAPPQPSSHYGAEALKQLHSEQKRALTEKKVLPNEKPRGGTSEKKRGSVEMDYISLSGSNANTVLTGEEALALADQDDENDINEFDHGLSERTSQPGKDPSESKEDVEPEEEVVEGQRRWEDTMARRAGVLPSESSHIQSRRRPEHSNDNFSSLREIKASLQPTKSNLEHLYSDIETSASRHQSTQSTTRDELSKQQQDLEHHGEALEYYQSLRQDLATWLGALRELDGMVKTVEQTRNELEGEMSSTWLDRFFDWGIDCAAILERKKLIQSKVAGKDVPQDEEEENVSVVDEFGRDVSSSKSLSRTKRWSQRRKRCCTRLQEPSDKPSLAQTMQCSNEDNIDEVDAGGWTMRQVALTEAVKLIPNMVKDEYLSIDILCSLFSPWKKLYPKDYTRCYASTSLVQMLAVLARLEVCSKQGIFELPGAVGAELTRLQDYKWFEDLREVTTDIDDGDLTGDKTCVLESLVHKHILRTISSIMSLDNNAGIYNPFSSSQTKRLCALIESAAEFFESRNESQGNVMMEQIMSKLTVHVRSCLDKMVVSVVDWSQLTLSSGDLTHVEDSQLVDDETRDAVVYASAIQFRYLCALATNLVGLYRINSGAEDGTLDDGAASLLSCIFEDVISFRIIPILATSNLDKFQSFAKDHASELLETLQASNVRTSDRWMMLAAPLRAAVQALQ